MSHQKTTLKEFISFYKELNITMKTCIEGLTKLSKKTCNITKINFKFHVGNMKHQILEV